MRANRATRGKPIAMTAISTLLTMRCDRHQRTILCSGSCSRRKLSDASTGIRVRESTKEPASANTTVKAIGRNSLPSIPTNVRIGR